MKTDNLHLLVENILDGVYPYDNNNDINNDLLHSWDTKYKDIIVHLKNLASSSDYMVLSLLVVIIENIELKFIKFHRQEILCIIKKAMLHHCPRPNFYFFKILIELIHELEDIIFYWDMLKSSEGITQNSGISLLKYIDSNLIDRLYITTQHDSFLVFLNKSCIVNNYFLNEIDNLNAKIYATGLHCNGVDKFKIIENISNRDNYDLMDYIYIYLD